MTRRAVPAFAIAPLLLVLALPVAAQEGRPEMSAEEQATCKVSRTAILRADRSPIAEVSRQQEHH